jgi:hypothetical protein
MRDEYNSTGLYRVKPRASIPADYWKMFKGENFMTPHRMGFFKLRVGYAELNQGEGMSRQPIYGVTQHDWHMTGNLAARPRVGGEQWESKMENQLIAECEKLIYAIRQVAAHWEGNKLAQMVNEASICADEVEDFIVNNCEE